MRLAAANKALAIDPSLAGAEAALAYVALYYQWDGDEAGPPVSSGRSRAIRRSVLGAPLVRRVPDRDGPLRCGARANRPARSNSTRSSHAVNTDVGFVAYYWGATTKRSTNLRSVFCVAPNFPLAHSGFAGIYQEQEARRCAGGIFAATRRIVGDWPVALAAIGHVLGKFSGRAARGATRARRARSTVAPALRHRIRVALVHAGLGRHHSAFDWLDRAVAARSHWLVWLQLDPRWNSLRQDVRVSPHWGRNARSNS